MFGFLVINKPLGITSRSAINRITRCIRRTKIGHAGTLDPLATGVLVVGIGPATRLVSQVQQMHKFYTAEFRLGVESETEDTESTLLPVKNAGPISESDLTSVLPSFQGTLSQLPPKFSALKVAGRRAHELARENKVVLLKPRPVEIYHLKLASFDFPNFQLEIECGSGTYVRSLGRDIGRALGSGAVMTGLERTAIGEFNLSQAIDFENADRSHCEAMLISPNQAVTGIETKITVSKQTVYDFTNGVPLNAQPEWTTDEIVALDEEGHLIAILKRKPDGTFAPTINFAHYWVKRNVT